MKVAANAFIGVIARKLMKKIVVDNQSSSVILFVLSLGQSTF